MITTSEVQPQNPPEPIMEEAIVQQMIFDGQFVAGNGNGTVETNLLPEGYTIRVPVVEVSIEEFLQQTGTIFDFK